MHMKAAVTCRLFNAFFSSGAAGKDGYRRKIVTVAFFLQNDKISKFY